MAEQKRVRVGTLSVGGIRSKLKLNELDYSKKKKKKEKSRLTGLNGSLLDWISKGAAGAAGQEACNEQSALSVIYHILAEL